MRDVENLPAFNFSIEKKGFKQSIADRAGLNEEELQLQYTYTNRESNNFLMELSTSKFLYININLKY